MNGAACDDRTISQPELCWNNFAAIFVFQYLYIYVNICISILWWYNHQWTRTLPHCTDLSLKMSRADQSSYVVNDHLSLSMSPPLRHLVQLSFLRLKNVHQFLHCFRNIGEANSSYRADPRPKMCRRVTLEIQTWYSLRDRLGTAWGETEDFSWGGFTTKALVYRALGDTE